MSTQSQNEYKIPAKFQASAFFQCQHHMSTKLLHENNRLNQKYHSNMASSACITLHPQRWRVVLTKTNYFALYHRLRDDSQYSSQYIPYRNAYTMFNGRTYSPAGLVLNTPILCIRSNFYLYETWYGNKNQLRWNLEVERYNYYYLEEEHLRKIVLQL